jgi:hypothetical protein
MARESIRQSALLPGLQVNRRALLAIGGAAAVGGGAVYLGIREGNPTLQQNQAPGSPAASPAAMDSRATPVATPPPTVPVVQRVDPADVIEEASVSDLRNYLDDGTFTIAELVQACLDRIEDLDRGAAGLNAVIELNPDRAGVRCMGFRCCSRTSSPPMTRCGRPPGRSPSKTMS